MIGPVQTRDMPFEKLDPPGTFQPNHSGLWRGFMRSAEQFPERPALIVEGRIFYYWQLREKALRTAATL